MSKIVPTSIQIPLSSILSLLFFLCPFHGTSQATDTEQTILLRLKQHWSNPPSIGHWTPSSNSTSAHCDWRPEITCSGGSVTGLSLADKGINGTVPPFICDLKSLAVVDLSLNYIPGPFPTVFYNCSKLEFLNLSMNSFTGGLPGDIHRLSPKLLSLDLSRNNFTGDIPPAIGRFPELRNLWLYYNLFNGSFPPEMGNLSNLEVLHLSFNEFTPMAIPSSFTKLTKLKELQLRESNLIGEIPKTIGNLTALEVLDLATNGLTGNIPESLFVLTNLTTLYLFKNHFSGSIPNSVAALNLEIIDLSENNLTGTIPEGFGKLERLLNLSLFSNYFAGELPESIGRLPALISVKLFSNNFSGELPTEFGQYSKLAGFEVASNQFSGMLPKNLCANGALVGLVAFDNHLSGELPNSLGNCWSLMIVQVQGNQLSGSIPSGLWELPNLTTLMLNDNSFSGHLPEKLATNLSRLEISNNEFSGEIPVAVSSWKHLTVFNASNNLFMGPVPQELTALPLLTVLLLDENKLSGHLPLEIVSWNWLSILNLSKNQLSGPIPAKIGSLPRLTDLDLSGNEFSGLIPPQIGLLKLSSLNLSSNRLTGEIPSEFENSAFEYSFLNNPGLCAQNPSSGLSLCSSGTRNSSKKSSLKLLPMILGIAAALLFALAILVVFLGVRTFQKTEPGILDSKWEITRFQTLNFDESDILSSLTESNVIGSGGSGKVYRVVLRRSGKVVAVKRIQNIKKLDKNLEKEFQAEVQILGTIRHSNIVKLLCYISNENSKLLVYEYVENRSLDRWLHHGKNLQTAGVSRSGLLDWPKRLQIAVGTARGLCYMHHECPYAVIHRDVKSSNILLDAEFNPKVADFGLARMLLKDGEPDTVSAVAGSFGYMAPEYAYTTRVSEKIDVYSFGVVLLELATGREPNNGNEDTCLAEWSRKHIQQGNSIADALDPKVREDCDNLDEMVNVFKLGIFCTAAFPSSRPSMKDVLQFLLRPCSHHQTPLAFGAKDNAGREHDVAPLLENGDLAFHV